MAIIQFLPQAVRVEGAVFKAVALATGDETSVITINGGNSDVTVHLYGTVGGATVAVVGSLLNSTFATVDDAYGSTMSFTALAVIKPVGPAVCALKVTVTGGTGVSVTADVYIVSKVR